MRSNQIYVFVITSVVACQFVVGFENSVRRKTVCPDGGHVTLICSDNYTISIENIDIGNTQCKSQSSVCNSELFSLVNGLCNGTVACNVTSNIFPRGCTRSPRYVTTHFECSRFWSWTHDRSTSVCTNSLPTVKCSSPRHIHIERVKIEPPSSECDSGFDETCALDRMTKLCQEKRACSEETENNSCLFEKMSLRISYICSGNTSLPSSNSSDVTEPPESDLSSPKYEITEEPTEISPTEPRIMLEKDNDGRLLVKIHEDINVLCVDDWDNKTATVTCKMFNLTSGGRKTILSNANNYTVLDFSLNCTGHESSLLECDHIEKNCSSTEAAGVVCCEDVTVSSPPAKVVINSQESSTTGIALGITFALVVIAAITLVFVYFQRRGSSSHTCIGPSKKPKTYVTRNDDDYIGQQGLSLPQSSQRSSNIHQMQYTKENTAIYANQTHANGREPSENTQMYSLASDDEEQSEYATSQDGVYDKARDRRHISKDTDLYGHSVDTVYDTAGSQKREMMVDNTYGRTVENVYDSSVHLETNDEMGGVYSRAVESAYDKRGDDTYDHT